MSSTCSVEQKNLLVLIGIGVVLYPDPQLREERPPECQGSSNKCDTGKRQCGKDEAFAAGEGTGYVGWLAGGVLPD